MDPDRALAFVDASEWREWLERNHAEAPEAWLVYWKRHTGRPSITWAEAVEEALCFGWIDGGGRRLDDERTTLWFTRRKRGSVWSASNKKRVERLEREGRMTEHGRAAIARAKADGSWTVLDGPEALEVPPDLAAALAANHAAAGHFHAFPPGARKLILTWIATAKREETRRKRIDETVRLAAEGKRARS